MKYILFYILFTMLFVMVCSYNDTTYNNINYNIIKCQSFSIISNIRLFSITSTTIPIIVFDHCNNTLIY